MEIKWRLDIAIVKNVIIGRINQLPAPDDAGKGSIRKQAPWQAYGMVNDWEDTDLGNEHASWRDAQKAVEDWYSRRTMKPCPAHHTYRSGCVSCEAANR
jgi:hypothetical protein